MHVPGWSRMYAQHIEESYTHVHDRIHTISHAAVPTMPDQVEQTRIASAGIARVLAVGQIPPPMQVVAADCCFISLAGMPVDTASNSGTVLTP